MFVLFLEEVLFFSLSGSVLFLEGLVLFLEGFCSSSRGVFILVLDGLNFSWGGFEIFLQRF